MQYFGVPKCPYCGKRVNLIRTWSLKKEGEYRCPRCRGISNIFLSPLIYALAVLSIFAGIVIYFYFKFIVGAITLKTLIPVSMPFIIFFLLSHFMPYLKRPVIKKVPLKQNMRKPAQIRPTQPMQAIPNGLLEEDDYLPRFDSHSDTSILEPTVDKFHETKIMKKISSSHDMNFTAENRTARTPIVQQERTRPIPKQPQRTVSTPIQNQNVRTNRLHTNSVNYGSVRSEVAPRPVQKDILNQEGTVGRNITSQPQKRGIQPSEKKIQREIGGKGSKMSVNPLNSPVYSENTAQNPITKSSEPSQKDKEIEVVDIPRDFFSKNKNI